MRGRFVEMIRKRKKEVRGQREGEKRCKIKE